MCYRFSKLTTLLEHEIHSTKKSKYSGIIQKESDFTFMPLNTSKTKLIFRSFGVILIAWRYSAMSDGDSKPYMASAHGHNSSVNVLPLSMEAQPMLSIHLHTRLKNSLKFLFHIFSYTQIQSKIPKSHPFNLEGYSVCGSSYKQPLQFTAAILILYLSSISTSHFETPKTRSSFPVSLSFTQPNIVLKLLKCRIAQGTCTQLIIYHDLQSFLCHCFSRRKQYPISETCILVPRTQWIYSKYCILVWSYLHLNWQAWKSSMNNIF